MTTALDLISRSLRLLGVYSIGESPSADESQDALDAMNTMLDSWAAQRQFIFAPALDQFALTAGVSDYTVGPSGSTITARPVKILAASYVEYQGVSYPLLIDTLSDYSAIPVKQQISGIPTQLYALMNMPDITVTFWPVPSVAMTCNLWSEKVFKSFASLTDSVNLPPGTDRAIVFSLAEEIAPEYGIAVSPDIARKASFARKVIKRTNAEIPRLCMPYGVPMGNRFNYRYG